MKYLISSILLAVLPVLAAPTAQKYAVVLQSGNETNESAARAKHALIYALDLIEDGFQVVIIFDGAGTGWAHEFSLPEHPMHETYMKLKAGGIMEEVCISCAEAMGVKEKLQKEQKDLLTGVHEGHPSIVKWIRKGYRIITL